MEKNERDYIEKYQQNGYTNNFQMQGGNLVDLKTKNKYKPDEIFIVAEHRFEGMSNPSDLSILFIIETDNGKTKGNVLAGYGPANDSELAEFFSEIPKDHYSNKANIIHFDKQ